jgi:trimethylamine--corrinoid protein Co-methyltransferase
MNRNIRAGKKTGGGIEFKVFTEDELHDIHTATLEILWKTGIFVETEEALAIFDGGGAKVNSKTNIVKIPPYIVEDSIRSAPETFILAGRDPKNDIVLEKNRVAFDCFGEAIQLVDPRTHELREPTKADLADCSRIVDSLNNISFCHRPMGAHDAPPEVAAIHNAEAMLNSTSKHCFVGPQSGPLMKKIIKMLEVVVGGKEQLQERPIMTFGTCAVTPLKLPRDCCEIVIESARGGLVAKVLSQAMAGGSSPVTLAGTLALFNAEVLSGLVLAQLTRKGCPFLYSSSTCSLDLRFGTAMVGNPETAMINAGIAQMARNYKLPCQTAGG